MANPLLDFQALMKVTKGYCPELLEPQFHRENISEVKFWEIFFALLRLPNEVFDHILKFLYSGDKKSRVQNHLLNSV